MVINSRIRMAQQDSSQTIKLKPNHSMVSSTHEGISYNGTMFMIAPVVCIRSSRVRQRGRGIRTDGNIRPIDTFLTWFSLHAHDYWLRGWMVDKRREKRGEANARCTRIWPFLTLFLPQNGATRILVSSRKSGTGSAPNNRIRKAQTGETKCALGGSVSMDKNNKRV